MKKRHLYNSIIVIAFLSLVATMFFQVRYMFKMRNDYNNQFFRLAQSAVSKSKGIVEKEALAIFLSEQLEERFKQMKHINCPLKHDTGKMDQKPDVRFLSLTGSIGGSPFAVCPPWMLRDSMDMSLRSPFSSQVQKHLMEALVFHQEVISEVIVASVVNMDTDTRPLCEKISHTHLNSSLKSSLAQVGINEPFVYKMYDRYNRPIYEMKTSYEIIPTKTNSMRLPLFEGMGHGHHSIGSLEVIFYKHDSYGNIIVYGLPTLLAILINLVIFAVAIFLYYKQQQFDKDRRNFVHYMTHELKTPVTSIQIAAGMLNEDVVVSNKEKRNKFLSVMKAETDRFAFLADKILQFTLVEDRKIKYHLRWLDCREIVDYALTIFTTQCERLEGSLKCKIEAEYTFIHVDKVHLQNVVFNLLENAIKYSKPNTPPHLVLRLSNPEPHLLRIAVTDNGIGIAKQDQKDIFKKYFRVNTGNVHNTNGFGLGLSYVQKVVTSMGGYVAVESNLGEGTTMMVHFPAEQASNIHSNKPERSGE